MKRHEAQFPIVVKNAIMYKAHLRLGAEWFDRESELIHRYGTEKGTEIADNILWHAIWGFTKDPWAQCETVERFLALQFRELDDCPDILTICPIIEEKCKTEISACKEAQMWASLGYSPEDILVQLHPKLPLLLPEPELDAGEKETLESEGVVCLERAIRRVDYKTIKSKAFEWKGDENEKELWFASIFWAILKASLRENNKRKICSFIRKECKMGAKPPMWLPELVGDIIANCRKEALALIALEYAVKTHCPPERVREIVQERLDN